MYKIIGADGQEYGPVTTDQLRQWIAEGRVNAGTLAQAEGSADWKAVADFPELAAVLGAAAPGPAAAIPPAPADSRTLTDQMRVRDYQVEMGGCISAGWDLVKGNFGLLVGSTVIAFLIMGVAGAIPFVGGIAGLIINGPLMGGLYLLYLRCLRAEEAELGDIFDGFRLAFGQLILTQLVISLLAMLCVLPGAVALGLGLFSMAEESRAAVPLIVVGGLLLAVGFPISVYLSVSWIFAMPLVIDKQLGFWEAMNLSRRVVTKHWWAWFGFFLLIGLVALAGMLACCVGVLVTGPIALAAMMYAYEDVFGQGTPPAS